ncbi:MAG: AAA family ATPase [Oscillospiraceae bacterium]|jgi:hypothetical protein|nr:AAA family ATPase [Oscillospiraceae bacterium]
MIIWINGAFGSGKTSAAFELNRRLPSSFVYDPENAGYFLRRNAPAELSKGDFQDIPLWREINYKLISLISSEYSGTLIIPMTLVDPAYYDELVGRLKADGLDIRHFILYASKKEILHRLRFRASRIFGGDTFAVLSIDRCINSFDNLITEDKIYTERMTVDEVVNEIAQRCGFSLPPDKKTRLGRFLYRVGVLFRHIR